MKEKNKNVSGCMHMLSKLKMGKNIRASFKYKSKKIIRKLKSPWIWHSTSWF